MNPDANCQAHAFLENHGMQPRTRILAFGSAGALALAGALCAALVGGAAGLIVGVTLLSLGLGAAVLLVFLEVGLSEDHARDRDEQRSRARTERHVESRQFQWSRRPPRRPD